MWQNLIIRPFVSRFADLDLPTQKRLRATLSAAMDAVLNGVLLFGFAMIGTIGYHVPVVILALALVFNALIMAAIASGATLRMRDPAMTAAQVAAACVLNLLGIGLAPQIAYAFILNLFVPLCFGSLYFTRREFLLAWCLLTASLIAMLMHLGSRVGMAFSTPAEQWLCYLVLALAFGRFLAINAVVARLHMQVQQKNRQLAQAAMQLAESATHDEMTGLWNRRQSVQLLQDEIKRTQRTGSGLCLAIVDADHFAAINKAYGVGVGDMVLQKIAQLLEGAVRSADRVGRYGGEEFILLLVDIDPDAVDVMVDRLRETIASHAWNQIRAELQVNVSIGFTRWHPGDTHGRMLNRAGVGLHRAKHAGRNRIEEECT